MNYFEQLLQNPFLINTVAGWFCAQLLKTIIHLIVNKKLVWERFVGDGGMPSGHSATVCSLATTTFFVSGPSSAEFVIALILAIIVTHDACGVRLETEKQARLLNEITEFMDRTNNTSLSDKENIKTHVGHTKAEVLVGALIGIVVSILLC
nr:divergent PAP2 family protein [Lachnospiraceae bacterium]